MDGAHGTMPPSSPLIDDDSSQYSTGPDDSRGHGDYQPRHLSHHLSASDRRRYARGGTRAGCRRVFSKLLRSPEFYLSLAVAGFSCVCVSAFGSWGFTFGAVFAAFTAFVALLGAALLGEWLRRRRRRCLLLLLLALLLLHAKWRALHARRVDGCVWASTQDWCLHAAPLGSVDDEAHAICTLCPPRRSALTTPCGRLIKTGVLMPWKRTKLPAFAAGRVVVGVAVALLVYHLYTLADIHYSAPDPGWTAMPTACHNNTETMPHSSKVWPVMNCAILREHDAVATAGLAVPRFQTTVADAQLFFEQALAGQLVDITGDTVDLQELGDCSLIKSTRTGDAEAFSHWRCISPFLGYPDDLAMRVYCDTSLSAHGTAVVELFSQARLGTWDWRHNEFRVRLVGGLVEEPFIAPPSGGGCTGMTVRRQM